MAPVVYVTSAELIRLIYPNDMNKKVSAGLYCIVVVLPVTVLNCTLVDSLSHCIIYEM